MMNPPGQGAAPRPARGAAGGNSRAGLGAAALPGPGGKQLASRVASGAITGQQAKRTMQQRQTLAKALGPDWRKKLTVGGKSFAQVRRGLAKNPGNAKLAAINKRLTERRSQLLESAREKNNGGGKKSAA